MNDLLRDLPDLAVNRDWARLPLFDRKGWRELPFGEFAENANERVEPTEAGDTPYVGLEHVEPEDLHIRTWGKASDVIGTKLRFRKGDVIFGRRRAYQRKLAVAEFDGICSAHAMVVRAKPALILPEFLPFVMMSDTFMNRAVQISVGSLSPTVNWSVLRNESFALPPLDQQRRLAHLMKGTDECVQGGLRLKQDVEQLRSALVAQFLASQGSTMERLGERVSEIQYGTSQKALSEPSPGSLPVLRIPNVVAGRLDVSNLVWLPADPGNDRYLLNDGDILLVRTNGNPDYVGRAAMYRSGTFDRCIFASYLIRVRCGTGLSPDYLHLLLGSTEVRQEIRKHVKSTAGNYNLNTKGIEALLVPVPDVSVQGALVGRSRQLESLAQGRQQTTYELRRCLVEMIRASWP